MPGDEETEEATETNGTDGATAAAEVVRCPACGKRNPARPGLQCARCREPLGIFVALRAAAGEHRRLAALHLRRGEPARALDHARDAWQTAHTPAAARLGFLAALAARRPREAAAWLRRTGGGRPPK